MPREYRKICAVCGTEFSGTSPAARYCCADCRRAADRAKYRERKPRRRVTTGTYTCTKCGRRVTVYGRTANRKYCGECLANMGAHGRTLLQNRRELREEITEEGQQ